MMVDDSLFTELGLVAAVVDAQWIDGASRDEVDEIARLIRSRDQITIAIADGLPRDLTDACDVVFSSQDDSTVPGAVVVPDPREATDCLVALIADRPRASLACVWLLRASAHTTVPDALVCESATYSMLLASAEFARWLAGREKRAPGQQTERVGLERVGDELRITLVRPTRRNAVDAAMRDALWNALQIAISDPQLTVVIDAIGPSFSAGGDLDEFGTYGDPTDAHIIRISRSVGREIDRIRERVTVRVHGACIGAGIELPSFAGRVIAAADAFFQLPELAMGLVPGAGGTVSITRRIGAQRTAWLALSGERIDSQTALRWGLVDAVVD
jgi:hypothetical protein